MQNTQKISHTNFMGGVSFDINNPIVKLKIIASSSLFGEPKFYKETIDQKISMSNTDITFADYLAEVLNDTDYLPNKAISPANAIEEAIDEALNFDPELTLQEAVHLRNVEGMRKTPQVIMVRAANHPKVKGTGLLRKYAKDIMVRPDEPAVQMAYQIETYGKKIPMGLKRAWKDRYEEMTEFQLNKYKLNGKVVNTFDVINICHPKSEAINKLMRGELSLTEDDTWEALISKNGSNTKSWEAALKIMSHDAILKNLRNFNENMVNMKDVFDKLKDTVKKSKLLPFHYYNAFVALDAANYGTQDAKEALSFCIEHVMGNLPKFKGKVISLCDNSGSAQSATTSEFGKVQVSSIANLSGILTAKNSEEGYVAIFGDYLKTIKINQDDNVFDKMKELDSLARDIGQGTENGIWLFFDKAIKNKEDWSNIFVYSDMQAGHGGLYGLNDKDYNDYKWKKSRYIDVPKLINKYRSVGNKDVNVFLVQVAGYKDTLVPEFYKRTYVLGGWSSSILKFAHSINYINDMVFKNK